MSDTPYAQTEQVWDPRLNSYVEQITYRDFSNGYSPPSSGIMEYQLRIGDGERRHTWRQYSDGNISTDGSASAKPDSPGVVAHGICEPQPLITHPMFQKNGAHELSDDDKQKIMEAEGDPAKWIDHSKSTTRAALAFYAAKRLRGIDSYLLPSVTIQTTADETALPNLSAVGKIGTPQGSIPSLPAGITFLLTGAHADPVAPSTWRVTRDWRGSGPKGWASDLYASP